MEITTMDFMPSSFTRIPGIEVAIGTGEIKCVQGILVVAVAEDIDKGACGK